MFSAVFSFACEIGEFAQSARCGGSMVRQEAAARWLKIFPGRRLEEHLREHLGDPTKQDAAQIVNKQCPA